MYMKRTLQIYISDVYISKSYVAYFKSKSFPPFPSSRSLTILQEKELTQCLKLSKNVQNLNDQKYTFKRTLMLIFGAKSMQSCRTRF